MFLLILGLALWYATHLLKPAFPTERAALGTRFGEGAMRGTMALLTLLAVALMVIGYQRAEVINVWFPPAWTVHLNNLLMVLAILLLGGSAPLSPIRRFTRHPMLNAVKTWAVAHLLVNGDLASIVLFGALLIWAVIAMIALNRRDGKPVQEYEWTGPRWLRLIGLSAVAFAVVTAIHTWLGVWPFPS